MGVSPDGGPRSGAARPSDKGGRRGPLIQGTALGVSCSGAPMGQDARMTLIAALLALLSAALTAGAFYLASTWLLADATVPPDRETAL